MSKGFKTRMVPLWVAQGIEAAFEEWYEMSGDWLRTSPEYHLTVKVAQTLQAQIEPGRRTLLMEPKVAEVLKDAGGVQAGPKAKKLRHGGRFDIVLGHADARPRVLIELKNPLFVPMGHHAKADLHRICDALLHGKLKTQLYAGVFAFYTSSGCPKTKDPSALARLYRRWLVEWRPKLQSWEWAGQHQKKYERNLKIDVGVRAYEKLVGRETHAWAAVCVQVVRKPKRHLAKTKRVRKLAVR